MEQDLRDEGATRSPHVVHVLPSDDQRIAGIVRAQVERIEPTETEGSALRLLVLVSSADSARLLAGAVNDGLDASGALLTPVLDAARGGRRLSLGAPAAVASPALARELLRQSVLKLDAVHAVVLVDLDDLLVRDAATLDDLLAELPRGADRVAIAADLTPAVEAFLERHARRPRRMHYEAGAASDATIQYVICDPSSRPAVLGALLDSINPVHATVVAAEDDAEGACSALARLGYGPEDPLVAFSDGDVPEGEELVILYTAPAEAGDLEPITEASPARVVALVGPDEVTSFLRVFARSATAAPALRAVQRANAEADSVRESVRQVLKGQALHHQLLTLAPLFEERDPAEVAAALLALVERPGVRAPSETQATGAAPRPAREPRSSERPERERPPRAERTAASGTFTPIFINVGMKDGARKGDLVGAITNESGISSDLLGKINMREMFSVVEVDASVADRVIEAMTGISIRGRIVNARVDKRPEERGERRDERRGGDRPVRRSAGGRPARDDARGPRARTREGFGGARGRDGGDRRRSRDDVGGPRPFRDGDRAGRGPRAIGESREWTERGERLRHARRPRKGGDGD